MKKALLFLLLITGMVNAQIVNIPDANFKALLLASDQYRIATDAGGNYIKIDANFDGEIQNSEALMVFKLNVSSQAIVDLTGISSFTNLEELTCFNILNLSALNLQGLVNLKTLTCELNKNLTSINLQGLVNLKTVSCTNISNLSSLNLQGLVHLETLTCNGTNLGSLDLQGLENLKSLTCSSSNLTSLDLRRLGNLNSLTCTYNSNLSALNLKGLVNLETLNCGFNPQLILIDLQDLVNLKTLIWSGNDNCTSLNLQGLVNLKTLTCINNNNLSTLNLQGLVNLTTATISQNKLSSLNLEDSVFLETLDCSINYYLTAIHLKGLVKLKSLNFSNCSFTTIDLGGLAGLKSINCLYNQLTSLDLADQKNLELLYCSYNNLTNLFVKNTKMTEEFYFDKNDNLQYICADDALLHYVQSKINQYGYTNCHVNTYCSFVPGVEYCTIKGTCKLDSDNNGCDENDIATATLKIKINDGTTNAATAIGSAGDYAFYTGAGSFTISPQLENPSYFTVSPTEVVVHFPTVTTETKTQDFCVTANGVHPDLEVVIAPISVARPGFDAVYQLVYKNKGNQTLSGTVNLAFDDAVLDLVTASPTVTSQSTNYLSWDYSTLKPYESRTITIILNVNSSREIPAVLLGDRLTFTTSITPVVGDEMALDNQFVLNQTVVGSHDPNDIVCLEGETVPPSEIGNYLHYLVNFENTGTYEAENVVVALTVDETKYDINSLQLVQASHDTYTRIKGNQVEFIFKNIKLPSSRKKPIGGHGDVLFKIKPMETLVANDEVVNQANIYFDYNAPITTNTAETTFAALKNTGFNLDADISIYPNPASSTITINANTSIKKIDLYDLQGRIIETALGDNKFLDISNKENGVYFLKVTTAKGSKVEKVIKN